MPSKAQSSFRPRSRNPGVGVVKLNSAVAAEVSEGGRGRRARVVFLAKSEQLRPTAHEGLLPILPNRRLSRAARS